MAIIEIFKKDVSQDIWCFSVSSALVENVPHFINDLKKDFQGKHSEFVEDTYLVAKCYISQRSLKIGICGWWNV